MRRGGEHLLERAAGEGGNAIVDHVREVEQITIPHELGGADNPFDGGFVEGPGLIDGPVARRACDVFNPFEIRGSI